MSRQSWARRQRRQVEQQAKRQVANPYDPRRYEPRHGSEAAADFADRLRHRTGVARLLHHTVLTTGRWAVTRTCWVGRDTSYHVQLNRSDSDDGAVTVEMRLPAQSTESELLLANTHPPNLRFTKNLQTFTEWLEHGW